MAIEIKEVPAYYQAYVKELTQEPLLALMRKSETDFTYLLNTISNEKAMLSYEEGKWSLKDLIQHVIDTERVFGYRALRFARNDKTELSGFEQDDYVNYAKANRRHISELMGEFTATRSSSISLFESFSEEELKREGIASGSSFSVEVLGYLISGHLVHHLNIIRERYL